MSNNLSQEEINALLGDAASDNGDTAHTAPDGAPPQVDEVLTTEEIDAMGEIGNISMGTAATTLSTLLSKKVDITTPRVSVITMAALAEEYPIPFVAVEVAYTMGLEGNNLLFLKQGDVMIMTDLMMGGDGKNAEGEPNEMHLSAISEVMNQMVGSSSTSLSQVIGSQIDITPPRAYMVKTPDEAGEPVFSAEDIVVKISFQMVVEGLINSEIMQIMPLDFAKKMIGTVIEAEMAKMGKAVDSPKQEPKKKPKTQEAKPSSAQAAPERKPEGQPRPEQAPREQVQRQAPAQQSVDVRPVQYMSFEEDDSTYYEGDNISLLMDVPLQVSVELGKSSKYIKEILEFNVGSIVVLDRIAGELVDVIVNGKLIAKGEVVVIEDNYGVRITDIVNASKRIDISK